MVGSKGWTQTPHPSNLILLPLSLSRPIQIPHPKASHSLKMCCKNTNKDKEVPDQWGSFFCLIDVGILSPNLVLLCTEWGELQWLRPLVAPVSSSAPDRGDCLASLDPCTNYFQSSQDLYHTHAGASGTAVPPGNSFCGFSLLLFGHRLLSTTEGQLAVFGWVPDWHCFTIFLDGLNIYSNSTSSISNKSFNSKPII